MKKPQRSKEILKEQEQKEFTQKKLKEAEFLNRSARELIALKAEDKIYKHLAYKLLEITPTSIIVVNSYDQKNKLICTESLMAPTPLREKIEKLLQIAPEKITYHAPEDFEEEILNDHLIEAPNNIQELTGGGISKPISEKLERMIDFRKAYAMGIVKDENLYGNIVIILSENKEIRNQELIQALVSQASIAIQRTQLEKELFKQKSFLDKTEKISQMGTWEYNMKTHTMIWSEEMYRILGFTPYEFTPSYEMLKKVIYPGDLDKLQADYFTQSDRSSTIQFEHRIIRPDGTLRYISAIAEIIYDSNQSPEFLTGVSLDLTETKKTQLELQNTYKKYHSVVNNAIEAIFVIQDDYFTFINSSGLEMSSYSKEEIYNTRFTDIIHPEDREMVIQRNKNRLRGKDYAPYDIRFLKKDQTYIWINLNATQIEWDGKPGVLCFASDITERKVAEQELKRSREDLKHFMDSAQDMIYLQDNNGTIWLLNEYFKRLGYRNIKNNLTLDELKEFLHPEDWKATHKFFERYAGKIERYRGEYRLKDAKDNWRWFDAKMVGRKNDKGEITGYYCIDRDITNLKNTEKELKKAKQNAEINFQKNQSLLKAIPDMMFVFHRDGTILDSHAGHEERYYRPQKEFLNKNIRETLPEKIVDITFYYIKKVLQTRKTQVYTYSLSSNKEEQTFEARMVYLFHDKTLAIVRDITERNQMFNKLEQAKEKAEESDRLKTSFLATMSHELRTPLNAIIGFSDLLSHKEYQPNTEEYSNIIFSNGRHLLSLINSILHVSSIEAGNVKVDNQEINLLKFSRNLSSIARAELKTRKKDHLKLIFNTESELKDIYLQTDETKLNQILVNLISNAIKYTEKGYVEFGYYGKGDCICLYVSDSGIGIPYTQQQKIFERFYRMDHSISQQADGVGLGLSISKKLADLLNIGLHLESEPGKGTTFTLKLSAILHASNRKAQSKTVERPKKQENLRQKNVLLAEDEESNYKLIEAILRKENCHIHHARDGKEAIELFKKHDDLDIILMDIKLPEMSGLEATRIIKKSKPEIPVIAITAYAMQGDETIAREAGCDAYITKPAGKNELLQVINDQCREH